MIRRLFVLLAVAAGSYHLVKQFRRDTVPDGVPSEADAEWANEGGANAPETV